MLKRLFDIIISILGLLIFSPILIPVMVIVYLQDYHSPFYVANRVGLNHSLFKMVKLRSMIKNADKSGVASTSANDNRITPIGQFIRKYKLDEVTQLWNVLIGDMSLVGPRPNVKQEVDIYTNEESRLLSTKPGITDLASIVFSDEGDILRNQSDPDLAYNQLIRPWKSKLGLIYIDNSSIILDIKLLFLTGVAIVSKANALKSIQNILKKLNAPTDVINVSLRSNELVPSPPPGSDEVIMELPYRS
jgi:lipopolysaccharide/colanic/teichoic acid biosynthesis glycosyltransferase